MILDIKTLALIQCLIFITQVIVLFVQFKVSRAYWGIGWWVLGSAFMALGVVLMPLATVKSMRIIAGFANPMVVLGQVLLYVGILRFLGKREKRRIVGTVFTAFFISYEYFIYISYDLTARTVLINAALAVITVMTAHSLLFDRDKPVSVPESFCAAVFAIYGFFVAFRASYTLITPIHTYQDEEILLIVGLIVPTIISILWTFGFVLMLNQRLNIEIQESEEKYRSILNASPDDITITDLSGRIIMISPASKKMFGYDEDYEGFIDKHIIDFVTPEDAERARTNIVKMFHGGHPKPNEYLGLRRDRSTFNIEINSGLIHDSNGKPVNMVFVVRDITERKLAEQKIQLLIEQLERERNTAQQDSITDSLTGLANRRFFDEMLATEFYRLKRSGSNLSLIMLDVDFFKNFNDSKGHLAGDDCLRQIGNVLRSIVGRTTDVVARFGGEEFVVILPDTESKGAVRLAEQIRKAVIDLAIPHPNSTISKYVTVSIGVASVSADSVTSPEQIVVLVDEALYQAKNGGRNQIQEKIIGG
jgi:diguanylate cyclase (GGDEF)-like protein/PAS domain S-box-containing protein